MKKVFLVITGVILLLLFVGIYAAKKLHGGQHQRENTVNLITELSNNGELKEGDIIFQTSLSTQSKAIQLATHSKYSHCGLIFKNGKNYFVFEAVQPVKLTPLNQWVTRGQGGHFVVKRLKNADEILTSAALEKMRKAADTFKGKNYDLYFEWSDDKIYCSELIWKMYNQATGLEIGKLQQLQDFDLTSNLVKEKIKERYGNKIPLTEKVISPTSIFGSELLFTVTEK